MKKQFDYFGARASFDTGNGSAVLYRLSALEGLGDIPRLPVSIKIMLEQALRQVDDFEVTQESVKTIAAWNGASSTDEIPFKPARVILQDFTGVPSVVDLAALRSAMAALGGDPERINPLVPVDLVIDHSVQVDMFGSKAALFFNAEKEFERNRERYEFLRWGQKSFDNFTVVPPATGIVHQVNLEYLAKVVQIRESEGERIAFPDSLVGTDSHTTMINGLGVLGWGVGGIEAEAVMLGQPISMLLPEVVGFRLTGELPEGTTATDLVLRVTQMLRAHGVVGRFVEFYGPGLSRLSLADRATIANMAPEYGATMGFFPVDDETLRYLRNTGRSEELVQLVERYHKEQGLFRTDETSDPLFTDTLTLELGEVEASLAGPKRPQDRVPLGAVKNSFQVALSAPAGNHGFGLTGDSVTRKAVVQATEGASQSVGHGFVSLAAITSCTNTSNPSVMIGAGLLAKKAVERGLKVPSYVKTSLAPGSRVVTEYLEKAGLTPYLEALGFHTVGYGCTTCIAIGTPVLQANGTARRIEQFPNAGGSLLLAPTGDGRLAIASQREMLVQGVRECVSLVLQDGRTLVCTPDHRILCEGGQWKRADELRLGEDRVMVGLEAPLDEPGMDEPGYTLEAGEMRLSAETAWERLRLLAFARLLGHLLRDGSISLAGQARVNVGQAIDREVVLNDIELLTGKRPAGTRYDERKWSIALPQELTDAIRSLSGVQSGRRIYQPAMLPAFVLDEGCPIAVVREFLGGLFGADGHAPILHRQGEREEEAVLQSPAYSQSALSEHVGDLRAMMGDLLQLLARCGVKTEGAHIREYPTRRSASTYPAAKDGLPRFEVRLELPDGLSFVERVGFRYCVDKALRASAAAAYWRLVSGIGAQRLTMADRLAEVHQEEPALPFAQARQRAAAELMERETPLFPHYSLLEGADRFNRLPQATGRPFRPLHRDSCGFPSPVELFREMGVRDWFAALEARDTATYAKRYCVEKEALTMPGFSLRVVDRRAVGKRPVYDLAVDDQSAFVAGTLQAHNCIGNAGPLPEPVVTAINEANLVAAAVLSGNRNFEGRISPHVKANYLASPPLVVAYALAGTVEKDLTTEPLGEDAEGNPVFLRDIWPTQEEVRRTVAECVTPQMFTEQYGNVYSGNEDWNEISIAEGALYAWQADSTYIQHPPFFQDLAPEPGSLSSIKGASVLALLGDSVTTDHISPAGSIAVKSPAGQYLIEHGVDPVDFNSYGSRRGNHEVMMRGTFANIRIKNHLLPGTEGPKTIHLPTGEETSIYDAAMRYQAEGVPLLVIAGKEYGTGSSRDWAAKGTYLLGVKAVLAESYERIHRSNLIGMGVLPLQFDSPQGWESLGLTGREVYDIDGIDDDLQPGARLTITAHREDGSLISFKVTARVDTPVEVNYYRNGGILHTVLRNIARETR